jgi:peptidoglycan hydrolase-like protein with peptidoglycan-binding domain
MLQNAEAALSAAEDDEVNPGTMYTSLPQVGQKIFRDQAVYALNGEPVPLLYGSLPAYRAFHPGMSDGPDVGELTQNLIALGFGSGLTQSNHFSAATAAAVEAWQGSLGLPETGSILLGAVVFEPGPIRVTSVTPSVGQSVAPGAILDATSTQRVVDIALPVNEEYLVKPGDAVGVVLPNGTTTVSAHVEKVSDVAVCPGGTSTGGGNGNSNAGQGNQGPLTCSGSNGSGSSSPTVDVTITLDNPTASGTLDQAPVNVNITTQRANDVLAVPISALLALESGGYGVDVVSNGTTHLVGVQTGLFSNTLVEISGSGITAGTVVEIPSQS